jgi:pimeloyl-ACP methyl ester carboxylesterase
MFRFIGRAALAAGAMYAAPALLKKTFAPPQRDASQTPAEFGLPGEQIWLESVNGTSLHAWFIPAVEAPAPAVVVLHGWGANGSLLLPLAPHLHEAGYHALFLDARNHGLSEHDDFSSLPRFAEDLEMGVAWLRECDDVTTVAVVGHSVGAGAAILAASRDPEIAAVVSMSAFAHPREMMTDQLRLTRLPGQVSGALLWPIERIIGHRFDEIAPQHRIQQVECPVLIVHGDADQVIPVKDAFRLFEMAPDGQVLIVPGGEHASLEAFEPHMAEMMAFLDRHLRD